MIAILTYFLLFGLMFFILPLGHSPYEVPKVFAAITFIIPLFLLNILKATPALRTRRHLLSTVCFLILISLALYHLFYPIYPEHLLFGNAWRPHGTILYLSLFLLFLIAKRLPFNISIYSKLSFYSLILLLVFTLLIGPTGSFRFIGPLGEPSSLAAVVLFLYPLTTALGKKQRLLSLIISTTLIVLAGSRIAVIAYLIELCITLAYSKKKIFIPAISLLGIIIIFSFVTPFLPKQLPAEYFLRFEDRSQIWQVSFTAAQNSPLVGTGFGSAQDVIYKTSWDTNSFLRFQSVDHTHNILLQWWIMAGPVGLLTLLVLISLSIWNFCKTRSFLFLSILIGILIIQLFNPVSIVTLVHLFWLIGVGVNMNPSSKVP